MARSRTNKESRRQPGASAGEAPKRRPLKLVLLAVAVIVALGAAAVAGWFWWAAKQDRSPWNVVEKFPSEGAAHITAGERVSYRTAPPTSGPHDPVPTPPGLYTEIQPPEKLVHSLEHGNIVIYVERPDPEVLQTLKKWVSQYPGEWDGIVVTPYPGLERAVILTAWQHRLRLKEFDPAAAAAFIDKFRGRGPEKPVR